MKKLDPMNFRHNPFEGLDFKKICKKIYKGNKTYEEDILEIEEIIGGENNFKSCEWYPTTDRDENLKSSYIIKVNDIEKTLFKKENFQTRFISEDCTVELLESGEILIRAASKIAEELALLCKHVKEPKEE